ncbi:MAG: type IX secretion system membrane protein PorP/SprF [Cyclobacteriaceae bacterium]
MKKILIFLICWWATIFSLQAQSRKYISQFSHFQSYYNPGLTGYEGSTFRGFVRNQWSGLEGAPKTYFLSAELDFAELKGLEDPGLMGKNALSVNMLHDTYGAFRETELLLAYASRIRLTKSHNLRLGAGLNYQTIRLDGNALSTEQASDPILGQYMGNFSDMQVFDFNLGLALTHENYYVSYAMHNVNGGKISGGEEFMNGKPVIYLLQAGYREALSPNLSLIINTFYRSQKDLPENIEFNVKTLLMDKIWIGAGHRWDYASNLQFGILMNKVRLGYIYEFPMMRSYLLPGQTHEFTAVFQLFGNNERKTGKEVLIW